MYNATEQIIFFRDIVSYDEYIIFIIMCTVVYITLSFFGIISNTMNMATFIAMGLNDGVTISFLVLSFFDLIYILTSFSLGITVAFSTCERITPIRFPVEPYGLVVILGNIMILLITTNVLATTFIAVARCMCVVKPLQFKNWFTVSRTVCFMAGFAIFAVAIYTPILANMGMVTRLDNKTKISRPTLWLPRHREDIKNVIFMIIDMIIPMSTEVIVLVCIMLMANSLQDSFRFRQTSQMQTCSKDKSTHDDKSSEELSPKGKLSGKELHVVKQVTLISVIYIICNTPKILISLAGVIEPEFRIGRRYNYFYMTLNGVRKYLEIINATINTFIYYRYNTKFKTTLISKWNEIKLVSYPLRR
ncbi:unnamed protein product [Candidula unifasciata]|uniref:G-protein coupled receptors family 1 profile domain-containing protein n=1 Tax=Candidula unifasciata TaxID=100452 RepID=A0A8S3ZJV1_9EUPU|nr:unnamed protein product [Candidula unifasciata]